MIVTNRVLAWQRNARGELEGVSYEGGEIHYGTCEVNDPLNPYDCGDCGAELAESELVEYKPGEEDA
jgi:hypothetical protein